MPAQSAEHAQSSASPEQLTEHVQRRAEPRINVARIKKLTTLLAERMQAASGVLQWCAGPGAGKDACTDLAATAKRATLYLALARHPRRLRVAQLSGTLKHLSAQIDAASALEAAAPAAQAQAAADAAQAALARYARDLSRGSARHSVPAIIPWHASTAAVLTVANVPVAESKLAPRLAARLTVLEGNAVRVVNGPLQVPKQMKDGSLKWVWTLEGEHEGRAEVRMELFIEPPPGARVRPAPYQTWEDDITVQASMLADIEEAGVTAGQWLFGGVEQAVRTVLIATLAAGLLIGGYWAWRRPADLRSLFPRGRRGPY